MNQLSDELRRLTRDVTSLYLDWSEDSGQWECSFIVRGQRFTGFGPTNHPGLAVLNAYRAAQRTFPQLGQSRTTLLDL